MSITSSSREHFQRSLWTSADRLFLETQDRLNVEPQVTREVTSKVAEIDSWLARGAELVRNFRELGQKDDGVSYSLPTGLLSIDLNSRLDFGSGTISIPSLGSQILSTEVLGCYIEDPQTGNAMALKMIALAGENKLRQLMVSRPLSSTTLGMLFEALVYNEKMRLQISDRETADFVSKNKTAYPIIDEVMIVFSRGSAVQQISAPGSKVSSLISVPEVDGVVIKMFGRYGVIDQKRKLETTTTETVELFEGLMGSSGVINCFDKGGKLWANGIGVVGKFIEPGYARTGILESILDECLGQHREAVELQEMIVAEALHKGV